MIHATTCIQPVASETIVLENGKSRTFIHGIESVLRKAFDLEQLLREQGFSLESVVNEEVIKRSVDESGLRV